MNWLNRLERRFPNLAIEGLIRYISLFMLTAFFLNQSGVMPYQMLYLDREAILAGEVWRLFTFLLIPASSNLFFLLFELSILVMCADGLESRWGSLKLTAYYFTGAAANILMALLLPETQFGSYNLYLSLFLGFATIFPDFEILLFFVIPVKIKYLAILSGGLMMFNLAVAPLYLKAGIVLSIANYLLFFAGEAVNTIRHNHRQTVRSAAFTKAIRRETEYRHVCCVCKANEISHPQLQFRYCTCAECGPSGKAFCLEHLGEHKKEQNATG
jgi:membrane associated rhomboid family serine protease